jgi:phage-related protein
MSHTFKFNDTALQDLGAVIRQRPRIVIAVPDIDFEPVPFKAGDLAIDNHRYQNVEFEIPIRSIPAFCKMSLQEFSYRLTDWLLSGNPGEYLTYRDTYNPGYYRRAAVKEVSEVVAVHRDVYETTITFSADPYLYSDKGLDIISYTSDSEYTVNKYIVNPEKWDSAPIIRIVGDGTFTCVFGDQSVILSNVTSGVVINKMTEEVYDLSGNRESDVIYTVALPKFLTGSNRVYVQGQSAFSVEVQPNWRRL